MYLSNKYYINIIMRFLFVPVLYNEFIKINKDYVILFNVFFNDIKKIKCYSINQRILIILLINEILLEIFRDRDYNKIYGDIYVPYFNEKELYNYYKIEDINNINSTDQFKVYIYSLIQNNDDNIKYFMNNYIDLVGRFYNFINRYWNIDRYDEELKKTSFIYMD